MFIQALRQEPPLQPDCRGVWRRHTGAACTEPPVPERYNPGRERDIHTTSHEQYHKQVCRERGQYLQL